MRTLKKVLALTVVLATLLSISAFAAFSDEESINENFVDAVNLLGALNVMTGDTEGTFRPTSTISRAEAAKMIYVIRNGGVDDKAEGWTGMSTFSDVTPGVWYEGYVNYCASIGIIDGIGGGLFNPSGAVTGVELAKMMLVVADYRSDVEGYTGAGWNLNVIRDRAERRHVQGLHPGLQRGCDPRAGCPAVRQRHSRNRNGRLHRRRAPEQRCRHRQCSDRRRTLLLAADGYRLPDQTAPCRPVYQPCYPERQRQRSRSEGQDRQRLRLHPTATSSLLSSPSCWAGSPKSSTKRPATALSRTTPTCWTTAIRSMTSWPPAVPRSMRPPWTPSPWNCRTPTRPLTKMTTLSPSSSKATTATAPRLLLPTGELDVITNLYEVSTVKNSLTNGAVTGADKLAIKSTAPVRFVDADGDGKPGYGFCHHPDLTARSTPTTPAATTLSRPPAKLNGRNITSSRNAANFENFTFEDDLVKDDVIAINIDVTSGEILYNVALVEPIVGELTRVTENRQDHHRRRRSLRLLRRPVQRQRSRSQSRQLWLERPGQRADPVHRRQVHLPGHRRHLGQAGHQLCLCSEDPHRR